MMISNRRGMILLEVMIALVILVSGVVVIAQTYRNALQLAYRSKEQFRSGLLMEAQIDALEMTKHLDTTLDNDPLLGPLSWTQETSAGNPPSWVQHTISLSWGQGQHANSLELSSYSHD